jgi:hypothetical protein
MSTIYISDISLNCTQNEKCLRQNFYRKTKHTLCSVKHIPKMAPFVR